MSPKSGWRVEEDYGDDLHPDLVLNLTLFIGLKVFKRLAIWQSKFSHTARGEMSRELIFWQAVAQYLNSGGSLSVVSARLHHLVYGDAGDELPEVSLPEGFSLLQTQRVWFTDSDGARERVEHLFINQNERTAVRWIEDIAFEETSMQGLLDDLYAEEDPSDET